MKKLSVLITICIAGMLADAMPVHFDFNNVIKGNSVTDLSKDKEFVKVVNDVFALELRIIETNSAVLILKSANETINEKEKQILAGKLDFKDYEGLVNSFDEINSSLQSLIIKYAELNSEQAGIVINSAIDKLMKEGRIANINDNKTHWDCLRQLINNILICTRTSPSHPALKQCIRTAYATFSVCQNYR